MKKGVYSGQANAKLKIWLDGKMINYGDANVPIMTHSLQYGSGIFEGVRVYETEDGPAIFRLDEHIKRFLNSAKIYSMPLKYGQKELEKAVVDTVRINKVCPAYIRPFAFYNDDRIGVSAVGKKTSVFIAAIPFGNYFEGKDKGITCKISSWRRINSNILPVEAKASGNYLNSLIANFEAKHTGFDEAIFLSGEEGEVAEGSGENIFIIKDNVFVTPDQGSDILLGVTRNTMITLLKKIGMEVVERKVHKEELYSADEVFFTGTAAEVTPIVNIDGIKVGNGKPGAKTLNLAQRYYDVVHGRNGAFKDWLTYVK